MLNQGKYNVAILEHTVRGVGDKDAVALQVQTDEGDNLEVLVWLTSKSMGIARRALALCGFDCDKESLCDLADNRRLLAGKRVDILIEEWNGKLRGQILLNPATPKGKMRQFDLELRAARKAEEEDLPF